MSTAIERTPLKYRGSLLGLKMQHLQSGGLRSAQRDHNDHTNSITEESL